MGHVKSREITRGANAGGGSSIAISFYCDLTHAHSVPGFFSRGNQHENAIRSDNGRIDYGGGARLGTSSRDSCRASQ
jgi:hypothetical protein